MLARSPLLATTVLLLALGACRDDSARRRQEPPPGPACGDGKIDEGEECDGSALGEASCESLGFESGSLACGDGCRFVTAGCFTRCGNGALDTGEECDGKLGPLGCGTWGYKSCSARCKLEGATCVAQPYQSGTALQQPYGGPAIVADIAPKGFGDLIAAVPARSRLQTYPYTLVQGFLSGRSVNGSATTALPLAADLDGDGEVDLAAINEEGTVDRFLFVASSNSFPVQPIPAPDAGTSCAAFAWVGAGKVDSDEARDLVALGCPRGTAPLLGDAFLVFRGGATPSAGEVFPETGVLLATSGDANGDGVLDVLFVTEGAAELKVRHGPALAPGPSVALPFIPSAIAAGDLDSDGDLDLLVRDGAGVKALENTGSSFAERYQAAAATPEGLLVADLDLDGRADLAWLAGDRVQLRRSSGQYQFLPYEGATGAGTPLTLAAGDLDGDGDLDLAATYWIAGSETVTYVLVNKVR